MINAEESFVVERRRRQRRHVASPTRLRPNDWSTTQVDPSHRRSDQALWLHPRQRWNEAVVGGLVAREQLRRLMRSLGE